MALLLAATPAVAQEARDGAVEAVTTAAADQDSTVGSGQTAEETAALARAESTGEPVEVLSQRTETSQVFANPAGDFTEHTYALPQWVRQDGRLVEIDTSLSANGDGTFSPTATEVGVTFSGGGDGPMATVVRDGRTLSFSWPEPLPEPVINGDTATYPEVIEGVDLQLQARSGGFGQVLVVKDAEAAANPELAELTFAMDTQGLRLDVDASGTLRALNPADQEVFTAGAPLMWDSSRPADAALRTALADAPDGATSDADGPGIGAQSALADLSLAGDTLTLTPDQELLAGEDTQYPVYIDPDVSGSRYSWTIAYKKYPNSSFFNGSGFDGGTNEARVGYENQTDGTARSFFRMNTTNLKNTNRVISRSVFRIRNSWSWSCTNREVELWYTGSISSGTTWNNQPDWRSHLDTVNDARGWGSDCPAGNLVFDTTAGARTSQANQFNTLTLGLRASNETDVYAWKKFDANSAVLSTTYNTRPSAPTGVDTYPVSTVDTDCGSAAPYEIIGNTDFYLQARGHDADGGTVQLQFRLWATGHFDDGLIIDKQVSVTSGGVGRVRVLRTDLSPHIAAGNGNFSWGVRASDGQLTSGWAPSHTCRFVFDPNRPSVPPGISSSQFPDGTDGWPVNTGSVRQEGSFTLSSGGVSDVTAYQYWTSWDTTVRTVSVSSGASTTLRLAPPEAGPNMLYARSRDRAGNLSNTRTYLFYAKGLSTPDAPGDINGDGNSDIWGIDADGNLTRHYGAGDGTVYEANAHASEWNWNGAKLTHQGDWTFDGYEDLVSLRPEADGTTHRLWVHPNSGWGFACSDCANFQRIELAVHDEANNHWSQGAKQILAIGDVDGGLDTDGDGVDDVPAYPDLLVNDGTYIWLYYGNADYHLDSYRDPVLLAGPDDPLSSAGTPIGQVTLAAPGDYTGDGIPELTVRYEPDTNGDVFTFEGLVTDGDYNIELTNRKRLGYGIFGNRYPVMTAAPSATSVDRIGIWLLSTEGLLRYLHYDYAAAQGGLVTVSDAFVGYQYIS
jgi:hypothetical protein